MKALQQAQGEWDRIATREELSQVFDLLENIPTARDLGRSQATAYPVTLAATEGTDSSRDLWLDRSEEMSENDRVNSTLESLAELFANRSGLVN